MLAMMGLSKALGYSFQYDHDDVWKTPTTSSRKRTGEGSPSRPTCAISYTTHSEMRDRVKRPSDHGVRICLMQGADSMYENING